MNFKKYINEMNSKKLSPKVEKELIQALKSVKKELQSDRNDRPVLFDFNHLVTKLELLLEIN